jgi:hypothetical protein
MHYRGIQLFRPKEKQHCCKCVCMAINSLRVRKIEKYKTLAAGAYLPRVGV